mgnify:CR=1 FL=1
MRYKGTLVSYVCGSVSYNGVKVKILVPRQALETSVTSFREERIGKRVFTS